jgi:hypothetical protein
MVVLGFQTGVVVEQDQQKDPFAQLEMTMGQIQYRAARLSALVVSE